VTTVIRALALKQISSKDMARIVLKEAGAGCMMGERVVSAGCAAVSQQQHNGVCLG
jgi:Mg/Co/Ni transporter MgtE